MDENLALFSFADFYRMLLWKKCIFDSEMHFFLIYLIDILNKIC